jgi:sugar phosphate isomerase/epimerase
MKRRYFIQRTGVAAGAMLAAPSVFQACAGGSDPMARIGLTTVTFRKRFISTNPDASGNLLTLEKIPEFFRDRFGIYQPEFWSEHFESRSPAYLKELKAALDKNHCTLVNIQADTPGKDMSNPENGNSGLAVEEIKEWIDVGSTLGSKMVRGSFMQHSLEEGIKSTRELVSYAKSKGITLLAENHFDLLSVPENHLRVAEEIGRDHFGLLADFGNYPEPIDKYQALEMIAPYTLLVSAKTHGYDENHQHIGFDFDRCVRIMEEGGFTGIYSLEQWEDGLPEYDYEKIVDWMILHVKDHIG